MYKFMGVEHKQGNFTVEETGEVRDYNNWMLHFVVQPAAGVFGAACMTVKVKDEDFVSILHMSSDDLIRDIDLYSGETCNLDYMPSGNSMKLVGLRWENK